MVQSHLALPDFRTSLSATLVVDFGRMGDHPEPGFGPTRETAPAGPPFSVTGASTLALKGRQGVASFAVANIAGRKVTARLLPKPLEGAQSEWLSVADPAERELDLASNMSVDVAVDARDAPAGDYAFRLDVAVEDAPENVASGPTVTFSVPVPEKKRFPWWIVIVAIVAVAAIGVGAWLIFWPPWVDAEPVNKSAPTITVDGGIAQVGTTLTVEPGAWDPAGVVILHGWQACPADGSTNACVDLEVAEGDETGVAVGSTYVVGAELEGKRIRVVETAIAVPEDIGDDSEDNLMQFPRADRASELTATVAPAPPEPATVPNVVGMTYGEAQEVLSGQGLQILGTTSKESGPCNPPIEDQNPNPGASVEKGSVVAVTTKTPPPIFECIQIFVPNLPYVPIIIDPSLGG